MPVNIAAERIFRENLLIQRGHLKSVRAELEESASDDSARLDAAKLVRLEVAAQLGVIEARLESIDGALNRLNTGHFGLCVECGKEISAERLEARPDAPLCMPCCQRGLRPK